MRAYPRQGDENMVDLGQDENGGGGDEPIRTTREPNQSNSGRGNENGVEGEPVTPDGGSQNPSEGNNPQADNGEQGIEGVPRGRANGSENVSGSGTATGGVRGNQQGGQKHPMLRNAAPEILDQSEANALAAAEFPFATSRAKDFLNILLTRMELSENPPMKLPKD